MQISLEQVGKRFGRHWIVRDYNAHFRVGEIVGVSGRNGSGKSTLLRMLAGQLTPSRGQLIFIVGEQSIGPANRYRYVSWTGPYLEIVEELTIVEFLAFHFKLKPLRANLTLAELPKLLELDQVRNRKLSDCSSGMRQRVLLGSALYADTPLLLLDEPTVTLDEEAVAWFHEQLANHTAGRLVFIASNDPEDLRSCSRLVEL